MKHQTPDSMKFRKFARRLGLRVYEAVGILQLLWIVTQKNAPRGDIGRYDDEEIAIELDWIGSPSELIEALVATGWLDRCPNHRLLVHDWSDHAPRWLHGVVSKQGGFLSLGGDESETTGDELSLQGGISSKPTPATPATPQSPTIVPDYSPPLQSGTTLAIVGDYSEGPYNITQSNLTLDKTPSESSAPKSPKGDSKPAPPSRFKFPARAEVGQRGTETWWILPQPLLDRYLELYGSALDVEQEIQNAIAWVEAHGSRRKSVRRMQAFVTGWLNRSANRKGIQTLPVKTFDRAITPA